MDIPEGAETYELSSSVVWFDENRVMYSKSKPNAKPGSREVVLSELEWLKKKAGQDKLCMIIESSSQSEAPSKEDRDFYAQTFEDMTHAMAIITTSPLSRMIANLFFGFRPPTYHVKMFTSLREAQEWISKFCPKKISQ